MPDTGLLSQIAQQWPVLVLFILALLALGRIGLGYLERRELAHTETLVSQRTSYKEELELQRLGFRETMSTVIVRQDERLQKFDDHFDALKHGQQEATRVLGRLDTTMTLNTAALGKADQTMELTKGMLNQVQDALRERKARSAGG